MSIGSDRLASFWLRVDRSQEHLDVLERDVRSVVGQYDNRIVVGHFDPQSRDYVFRLDEPFPPAWGLLVSEFANHARAVLDNLVWALAGPQGHGSTAFVIADSLTGWQQATTPQPRRPQADKLLGLSSEDRTLIERLQPYQRHDPPLAFAQEHPLSRLRWLSNEDKHRVLHAAAASRQFNPVELSKFRILDPVPVQQQGPFVVSVSPQPLRLLYIAREDNTEFLRLHYTGSEQNPQPQMRVHLQGALHVAFADPPRVVLFDHLAHILDQVRLVIRLFEPAF